MTCPYKNKMEKQTTVVVNDSTSDKQTTVTQIEFIPAECTMEQCGVFEKGICQYFASDRKE